MNPKRLYQWVKRSSKKWVGTTRHFQRSVAVFSRGVVLAQSSQIRKISGCVGGKANSQRRRLQRFLKSEPSLAAFFGGWTRSVVQHIRPKSVVLIVDETKLLDVWGVMVVGLAYHERCIPLAWEVYRANDAAAYPKDRQVGHDPALIEGGPGRDTGALASPCVSGSRHWDFSGLDARGIMALQWTFLFRVTRQSKINLARWHSGHVLRPGPPAQRKLCRHRTGVQKTRRVPAQVGLSWTPTPERWALVTNDPALTGWEYAQRMWIEEAFRESQVWDGWQLEDARLDDPQRMARLWIRSLVVAYTWMLLIGQALLGLGKLIPPKRRSDGSFVRRWSLFREGWAWYVKAHPPLRI